MNHNAPKQISLDELNLLKRDFAQNPGGKSCVKLGTFCLNQGQVQEAINIGAKGLAANPDNTQARLMVATCFVKLHQWQKAQVELAKVIKLDKNNLGALTTMGEVLLRQGDRKRAMPVLRHALSLGPEAPKTKLLFDCAKNGSSMPPLTPMPPVVKTSNSLGRLGLEKRRADTGNIVEKMSTKAKKDPRSEPIPERNHIDTKAAMAIRQRVGGKEKLEDAATKGLESSANAGEGYIERVLSAGLFDFPNVPVPLKGKASSPIHFRRSKKKKRLAALGVVLLFGLAFQTWKWAIKSRYKNDTGVALAGGAVDSKLKTGHWDEIQEIVGDEPPSEFVGQDGQLALAAHGVWLLGHRHVVDDSVLSALQEYSLTPGEGAETSSREHQIAQYTYRLYSYEVGSSEIDVSMVVESLRNWNSEHENDSLMLWLEGRAHFLARDFSEAKKAFEAALSANKDNTLAEVEAMRLSGQSNKEILDALPTIVKEKHSTPFARILQAFASIDEGVNYETSLNEISIGLGKLTEDSLKAWQHLTTGAIKIGLEDYLGAKESMTKAKSLNDPYYVYRQVLLYIELGDYANAKKLSASLEGNNMTAKIFLDRIDSEMTFANGRYNACLKSTAKSTERWARFLRGKCLFESNRAKESVAIFDKLSTDNPDDTILASWRLAAGLKNANADQRQEEEDKLLALSRKSTSLVPLYLLGKIQYWADDLETSRASLLKTVETKEDEHPNQMIGQSQLLLAKIEKKRGNVSDAKAWAKKSAELGFAPAKNFVNQF